MAANIPAVSQEDINANKGISILSYIGIFFLIPLFVKKDSPYCKFHANQGLVLFIVEIVLSILAYIPYVGFVASLLYIVAFVFLIMGIVNAATGKVKPLPLIGGITILK